MEYASVTILIRDSVGDLVHDRQEAAQESVGAFRAF